MYMTVPETAEYLGMPVKQIEKYILNGRIRAVYDGEQFLVNQAQFALYFDQLKTAKQLIQDYWNEPLPPDRDIKDED